MIDRWFQSVASSGQQENIGRPTCNSTMIAKAPHSRKGLFRFWWIQNEKHSSMSRVKSECYDSGSQLPRQWGKRFPMVSHSKWHFWRVFLLETGATYTSAITCRVAPKRIQIPAVSPSLVILRGAAACCCYLSTLCLCRHHLSTNLVTLEENGGDWKTSMQNRQRELRLGTHGIPSGLEEVGLYTLDMLRATPWWINSIMYFRSSGCHRACWLVLMSKNHWTTLRDTH